MDIPIPISSAHLCVFENPINYLIGEELRGDITTYNQVQEPNPTRNILLTLIPKR